MHVPVEESSARNVDNTVTLCSIITTTTITSCNTHVSIYTLMHTQIWCDENTVNVCSLPVVHCKCFS